MNTIIKAENVSKTYTLGKGNETLALNGVSLEIKEGEFVSVMGPSGSGKSTLLYSISGMDKITEGKVTFLGDDIESLSEKEHANLRLTKMGFVFQQSNLLKNLSMFDNIIVSAYLDGRTKRPQINERAMDLMNLTGVSHLKDNDITQASGGEQQRVSICRALINEPVILFGDEPTGALNSASSNEIMDIFLRVNRGGGTILMVTHDTKIAARSDRVLFMTDGQIMGEYHLGKYLPDRRALARDGSQADAGHDDARYSSPGYDSVLKKRETELSEWLAMMGF